MRVGETQPKVRLFHRRLRRSELLPNHLLFSFSFFSSPIFWSLFFGSVLLFWESLGDEYGVWCRSKIQICGLNLINWFKWVIDCGFNWRCVWIRVVVVVTNWISIFQIKKDAGLGDYTLVSSLAILTWICEIPLLLKVLSDFRSLKGSHGYVEKVSKVTCVATQDLKERLYNVFSSLRICSSVVQMDYQVRYGRIVAWSNIIILFHAKIRDLGSHLKVGHRRCMILKAVCFHLLSGEAILMLLLIDLLPWLWYTSQTLLPCLFLNAIFLGFDFHLGRMWTLIGITGLIYAYSKASNWISGTCFGKFYLILGGIMEKISNLFLE